MYPSKQPHLDKKRKAVSKQGIYYSKGEVLPSNQQINLYDPVAMPFALAKAHQKLDKAVETAYGRSFDDDSQRAAYLFELYQKLSGELFVEGKKRGKGRKG